MLRNQQAAVNNRTGDHCTTPNTNWFLCGNHVSCVINPGHLFLEYLLCIGGELYRAKGQNTRGPSEMTAAGIEYHTVFECLA